jgi:AraC-like DNA-binding protein
VRVGQTVLSLYRDHATNPTASQVAAGAYLRTKLTSTKVLSRLGGGIAVTNFRRSGDAPAQRQKDFCKFLIDRSCLERIYGVRANLPRAEELRIVIRQKGFRVKALAVHVGLDMRTLERHFGEQFRTTPKAWIMRERMRFAPPLLAEGLSNKEVAAFLSYTCASNFCRDFKRYFGCAPQEFTCINRSGSAYVAF